MGLLPQYEQKERLKAAFRAAFPCTIPIFMGFWFLGLAYGVYMHVSGFSFVYPMLMSAVIFGGSLEFVAVTLLLSPFAPFQALLVTLMIQARHLFYGLAMLDRFQGLGWKRWYLIFGLCDESFSLNYSAKIPAGVDRGWFMFFVTLLNQGYWVSGATIGGTVSITCLAVFGPDSFMVPSMLLILALLILGRATLTGRRLRS